MCGLTRLRLSRAEDAALLVASARDFAFAGCGHEVQPPEKAQTHGDRIELGDHQEEEPDACARDFQGAYRYCGHCLYSVLRSHVTGGTTTCLWVKCGIRPAMRP